MAHDYLKRYLTCSIPTGDLSDKEIDDYLRMVPTMGTESIDSGYRSLLRPGHESTLLLKLRKRMGEVPLETGKAVCLTVAQEGSLLRDPPNDWGHLRSTAGLVVRELVSRLQPAERKTFATQVLREALPLQFAVTCFGWMELQRNEHESQRIFSAVDEDDLRSILGDRITDEEGSTHLLAGQPSDFLRLLHVWQVAKGSSAVQKHVEKCLSSRPEDVVVLLGPFGNPSQTSIGQPGYDALKKLAAPDDLMRALDARGLLDPNSADPAARIAQSFAELHSAQEAAPARPEEQQATMPPEQGTGCDA